MSSFASFNWALDAQTLTTLRLDAIERAMNAHDYDLAVIEAEELLDIDRGNVEALYLLGQAMLETGDYVGAREVIEKVLSEDGPDATSLLALAVASFETCDLSNTVAAADAALEMSPTLAEAHFFRALALQRLGQMMEADQSFIAANQLDPMNYGLPVALDPSEWHQLVSQALGQVSPFVREFWRDVKVEFHPFPAVDELRAANPPITPSVSGLYIGIRPDTPDSPTRPEALRLYTGNLARCGNQLRMVEQIAHTLHFEACDWLDVDEPITAAGTDAAFAKVISS